MESSIRDGSPDKIASQTMSREANAFSIQSQFSPYSQLGTINYGEKNRETGAAANNFKFDQAGKYEFLSPEQIALNNRDKISNGDKLDEKEVSGAKPSAGLSERDQVSFVSAAFCNPLFLVGMGAAMAVLDDLREAREQRLDDALSGKANADAVNGFRRQADNDSQVRAVALKEETEEQKKKRRLLEATGLIGSAEKASLGASLAISERSILKDGLRHHQQKKDMRSKMREKLLSGLGKGWDEKAAQKSVLNWLKTNKLMKHKMKLENQIEKSRGKESLSFVSGLASKLEQVDKALKRAGV
ncbi:MAG: hypothetical protein KGS72_27595 [Cyanobacteria bacterium REEB67]|nr:hypothetical protein [Cyanobacteria bacterium REEB67]